MPDNLLGSTSSRCNYNQTGGHGFNLTNSKCLGNLCWKHKNIAAGKQSGKALAI